MRTQSAITPRLIGTSLILVCVALACTLVEQPPKQYPGGPGSYESTGEYKIDPNTILKHIDQPGADIFTPASVSSAAPTPLPTGSFAWHQEDYLRVADALREYQWKEGPNGWSLLTMQFKSSCQDAPTGFDSMELTYFKGIQVNGQSVYTARGFGIYPLFGIVKWGGGSNFPHPIFFGWKSIDLRSINVTADQALEVAEAQGAQTARLATLNRCRIYVTLEPGAWHVVYTANDFANIFEALVDARTGSHKILATNK